MNELIWIGTLLFSFILIILSYKFFGKTGLFMWIVVATIISSIQTIKLVNLFGLETSLGNILYGTTFLATDILNLKYGKKAARKTILYGFCTMITMTLFMIICLIYTPSANDFANESLKIIFTFNIRVTIASLIAFGISQLNDTILFSKLQRKYKSLWLSNNASTMVSQLIDTVIFVFITYYKTVDLSVIWQLMVSMYIFKLVIALSDTPFIYLANSIKEINND